MYAFVAREGKITKNERNEKVRVVLLSHFRVLTNFGEAKITKNERNEKVYRSARNGQQYNSLGHRHRYELPPQYAPLKGVKELRVVLKIRF